MTTRFATMLCCLCLTAKAHVPEDSPPPMVQAANSPRLRGGFSVGLGTFIPGPQIGGGGEGRVGMQFNQHLAVLLALGMHVGLQPTSADKVGGNLVGYLAALAEVSLSDKLFIALGPAFALGAWLAHDVTRSPAGGSTTSSIEVMGWLPGATARIGLRFAFAGLNGQQVPLSFALQASSYFALPTNVLASPHPGRLHVGFSPLLVFGVDWGAL